jgi:hypothetical protein
MITKLRAAGVVMPLLEPSKAPASNPAGGDLIPEILAPPALIFPESDPMPLASLRVPPFTVTVAPAETLKVIEVNPATLIA